MISDPVDALDVFDDPSAVLARNGATHPLIQHYVRTRDGRAYKMSDLLTREQLHRTQTYEKIFSKLGLEHQIAFTLPSQPTVVIGLEAVRALGLTRRQAEVLRLLALGRSTEQVAGTLGI
ncbi:MAG TPA: hypothetical protein VK506_15515 [Conexibacter sp.]|nr:hypothetical protein [Conexibacter sp.]